METYDLLAELTIYRLCLRITRQSFLGINVYRDNKARYLQIIWIQVKYGQNEGEFRTCITFERFLLAETLSRVISTGYNRQKVP